MCCRSVGLLLQISLPCVLFTEGPSELCLKGGTNAEMAPQIDYTIKVSAFRDSVSTSPSTTTLSTASSFVFILSIFVAFIYYFVFIAFFVYHFIFFVFIFFLLLCHLYLLFPLLFLLCLLNVFLVEVYDHSLLLNLLLTLLNLFSWTGKYDIKGNKMFLTLMLMFNTLLFIIICKKKKSLEFRKIKYHDFCSVACPYFYVVAMYLCIICHKYNLLIIAVSMEKNCTGVQTHC